MKNLIAALAILIAGTANATTPEVRMSTYPTRWRVIYDTDRDSPTGDQNYLLEGIGDAANGRVAGGTATGLLTVYGDIDLTGSTRGYFFEDFAEGAVGKGIREVGATGLAYVTTQLIMQHLYVGDGHIIGAENVGGGVSTIGTVMAATGLDITGDLTSAEGVELSLGYAGSSGRPFVVGTDPAFYTCATFTLADASGANPLVVGFRTLEIANATIASYNEYAYYGVVGTSNPNTIQIVTEVDAALDGTGDGATTTDTTETWADAASKKLCVFVSSAGVVTYTKDGAAPTVTAAATLTDGQVVVPFIYFLHSADVAQATILNDWIVARQTNAFQ